MYYVDECIKNTERKFPEQGREGYMRLDMNENPEGLPEYVVDKIREEITPEFLSRYPEQGPFIEKYANFMGLNTDQICLTNGSDNAIRYILQTFAEKGKDVLTVYPTFEMYMVNCWLLGLNHRTVAYGPDFKVDVEALIDAIDDNTDIVALVNPNNPLGDVYDIEDARRITKKAQEHGAIVVIDEAYHYFTDHTLISLIDEFDNVLLLRTFSKCLSLAGVRLGIVIGNPDIVRYVNNLRVTFEVNTFALKCGEIVLDTPGLIDSLADTQIKGREYLVSALRDNGYEVIPGQANFVSFKPKTSVEELNKKLREKGILVHTFGSGPLQGWIRVNTGSVELLTKFMEALLDSDRL